jgi:DNA-binding CsgD family transcriptional regulator
LWRICNEKDEAMGNRSTGYGYMVRKPVQPMRARGCGPALLTDKDWQRVGVELGLSSRELQVVQHIFKGEKLLAMARELGLAVGTVKTYSQRIHRKLNVSDQQELILAVIQAHLRLTNGAGRPAVPQAGVCMCPFCPLAEQCPQATECRPSG